MSSSLLSTEQGGLLIPVRPVGTVEISSRIGTNYWVWHSMQYEKKSCKTLVINFILIWISPTFSKYLKISWPTSSTSFITNAIKIRHFQNAQTEKLLAFTLKLKTDYSTNDAYNLFRQSDTLMVPGCFKMYIISN